MACVAGLWTNLRNEFVSVSPWYALLRGPLIAKFLTGVFFAIHLFSFVFLHSEFFRGRVFAFGFVLGFRLRLGLFVRLEVDGELVFLLGEFKLNSAAVHDHVAQAIEETVVALAVLAAHAAFCVIVEKFQLEFSFLQADFSRVQVVFFGVFLADSNFLVVLVPVPSEDFPCGVGGVFIGADLDGVFLALRGFGRR